MAQITQRPRYHFTAPKGWINDPNGFFFLDGWFHLFYQFNREHTEWASPSIGHSRTRDFIRFEELAEALVPKEKYDLSPSGGCFSGSVIKKDGKYHLLYTGSVTENGVLSQTQNLAVSDDGIHFERYSDNPVIPCPPEGADLNFRDPKVFEHSGKYWMVTGCRKDGVFAVFLYSSADLVSWTYKGVLCQGDGEDGTLAECPDLYPLDDGKWLLTLSPEYNADGIRSLGIIGRADLEECRFEKLGSFPLDYGPDYYARQCYLHGERRIAFAWLNQWPWMSHYQDHGAGPEEGWCGCLGMPREETYEDGVLMCRPVKELDGKFRTDEGGVLHVTPEHPGVLSLSSYSFRLSITVKRKCESGEVVMKLDPFVFHISPEHSYVLVLPEGKNSSVIPLEKERETRLDFYFDNSVLELFADGGRRSASWIFRRKMEKAEPEFSVFQKSCDLSYEVAYPNG